MLQEGAAGPQAVLHEEDSGPVDRAGQQEDNYPGDARQIGERRSAQEGSSLDNLIKDLRVQVALEAKPRAKGRAGGLGQ